MTHEVRDAVRILADCYWAIDPDVEMPPEQKLAAHLVIVRAIRHIASPDRAIFPKVRRSSKRRPICQYAGTTMVPGCDGKECPDGTCA